MKKAKQVTVKTSFVLSMLVIASMMFVNYPTNAQVAINSDGSNPDNSAMLDVKSTNKGFLPPRVANVSIVTNSVAGLMVFDISNQCIRFYNGNTWSDCLGISSNDGNKTCGGTITDIDGNIYNTVQIGNQCWMANDLKVNHYPNGDPIPYIDDNATWSALGLNKTDDAYCFYADNNNDGNVDVSYPDYGALYSYAAAIGDNWARDNIDNQGICPDGWHLPTDAEWTTLTDYLGGESIAGGKMKEIGTTHWSSPNTGADNSSGFFILPGGYRNYYNGSFVGLGNLGYWWSSTENGGIGAYSRELRYDNTQVDRHNLSMSSGFNVRCIRN